MNVDAGTQLVPAAWRRVVEIWGAGGVCAVRAPMVVFLPMPPWGT